VKYEDLELEVDAVSENEYSVAVIKSPVGETEKHQTVFVSIEEISKSKSIEEYGQKLFDILFKDEILRIYTKSIGIVEHNKDDQTGLRLKLRIRQPKLASIPWEFLYDPHEKRFLGLSRKTNIIRYPEVASPVKPLNVDSPLKILGMVASPTDLELLDISEEKHSVEEAIKDLRSLGLVELTWLEGQTWSDLHQSMLNEWHIFHFIGHGGFDESASEGYISLANQEETEFRLSATKLARLLSDQKSIRLALLNSCDSATGSENDIFTGTATALIRAGIPAVMAMQCDISDQAAIAFVRGFYGALVSGMPVDAATTEGRKAINMETDGIDWGYPVIYMRSTDGVLFDVEKSQEKIISTSTVQTKETKSSKQPSAQKTAKVQKNEGNIISGAKKFYHVDRNRSLMSGQKIELTKFDNINPRLLQKHVDLMFPSGVSHYGDITFLNSNRKISGDSPYKFDGKDGSEGCSAAIDIFFEYVRRSDYPNRPSRFESFFGFESLKDARKFREKYCDSNGFIWEVEYDNSIKADMNLLNLNGSLLVVSYNAHRYWTGVPGSPTPWWEVLLKPPIKVVKKVE